MPLPNLSLIMATKCCFDTHNFKNRPAVGGGQPCPTPSPAGNFAPSLCPPLTNPGHTTVSGVAIMGYKGLGPPIDWRDKTKIEKLGFILFFNVQKKKLIRKFSKESPYRGPTPFPRSVA